MRAYVQQQDILTQNLAQKERMQHQDSLIAHELKLICQEQQHRVDRAETGEKALEQSAQTLWTLQHDLKQAESAVHEKRQQEQELLTIFNHWRETQKKLRRAIQEPSHSKRNMLQALERWRTLQDEHARLKEQIHREELELRQKTYDIQQQKNALRNQQNVQEERIKGEKQKVEAIIAQLSKRMSAIKKDMGTYNQELDQVNTKRKDYTSQLQHYERIAQQFEKRKTYYHKWAALFHQLQTELSLIGKKQALCSQKHACPLCEQSLPTSKKNHLEYQLQQSYQHINHRKKRLETALKQLKQLIIQQKEQWHQLEAIRQEERSSHSKYQHLQQIMTTLNNELNEISHQVQQHRQHVQQLDRELAQLTTLHATEELDRTIKKQQKRVHELAQQLKQHSYDPDAHRQAQKQWNEYIALEHGHQNSQEYHRKQAERKIQFQELKKSIKLLKKHVLGINEKQHQLEAEQKRHKNLVQEKNVIKQEQNALQATKERLLQDRATVKHALQELDHQEQELKRITHDIENIQTEEYDFTALSEIFSRDGIQALLIEEALPEIELEANRLLAQLTHNQAHIIIDSLRDLKKGGAKETLDIKISDTLGIRPYELFSGGEAFRIDFALRIAISKLLARRAGTSLQTLIIDEGFGSQDEEGLSLLMDAIHKIKDQFEKVIIISHLPLLKEQFPVHFHVQKSGHGTTVNMIAH